MNWNPIVNQQKSLNLSKPYAMDTVELESKVKKTAAYTRNSSVRRSLYVPKLKSLFD